MSRCATWLLSLALIAPAAIAADLYKCTNAAGKVEFQDRPCDGKATAQKLAVQPNSVAPTDTTEINKKLDATNKRLADKAKADEAYRTDLADARAKHAARCQRFAEEIVRQQAWLSSVSVAVQQSAINEIAIQRQRMSDERC